MGIFIVGCAALGLLCVIANLLVVVGKIVVGLLKYVIGPVVLLLLVMGFIAWAAGGGL